MTGIQQIIVMSFGAVVAFAGLWLLFLGREGATNRIKLLGQEFELSTPALIVFLVGSGIFILPFVLSQDVGKSNVIERTVQESTSASKQTIKRPPASSVAKTEKAKPHEDFAPDIASTNRDEPTWLSSNEIEGIGVGEDISYYYTFIAGPGIVKMTVDGRNKSGLASAIDVELSDLDAKRLLAINMGNTNITKREVERVQLGRRQQIIMRVLLDELTIDYMVRLEGAVDFSSDPKLSGG